MSRCSNAHNNTVLLNDMAFLRKQFYLRRHENEYCPLKSEEREMSKTESLTAGSEDDASTVTTHGFESLMTGDSETEEEEEADP